MSNPSIKIWDDHNKKWLSPISILFGQDGQILRVQACDPGDNPLEDGWYDISSDHLSMIAIDGVISFNTQLLPKETP